MQARGNVMNNGQNKYSCLVKFWDRELTAQIRSVTVKPWELKGLQTPVCYWQ